MFAARLAAFTLAVLLFSDSIQPTWGWHLGLVLLTLVSIRDLVSFVAFLLSSGLLIGIVDASEAAYITLTIFTGAALLLSILASSPAAPFAARLTQLRYPRAPRARRWSTWRANSRISDL
jgi:hypothetical protein